MIPSVIGVEMSRTSISTTSPRRGGVLCLCLLATGCPTGPPPDDDDASAADDDDTGDLDLATLVGEVRINETTTEDPSSRHPWVGVWGLYDVPFVEGVFPEWSGGWTGEVWVWEGFDGDCLLATVLAWDTCEPPCGEDDYCDPSAGVCIPRPPLAPAGDLVFEGLNTSLTLSPNDLGIYVLTEAIPDPLFAPGQAIAVTASGGATPGFSASVTGVSALEPALDCGIDVVEGEDLVVTWEPSGRSSALVRWEMAQGHHAGNGPLIRCEGLDTGSLTVPWALLDAYDLWDPVYQTLTLTRLDRALVEVGGGETIAVEVSSSRVCLPSW